MCQFESPQITARFGARANKCRGSNDGESLHRRPRRRTPEPRPAGEMGRDAARRKYRANLLFLGGGNLLTSVRKQNKVPSVRGASVRQSQSTPASSSIRDASFPRREIARRGAKKASGILSGPRKRAAVRAAERERAVDASPKEQLIRNRAGAEREARRRERPNVESGRGRASSASAGAKERQAKRPKTSSATAKKVEIFYPGARATLEAL